MAGVMSSSKAVHLLVIMPLKSVGLGLVAGAASYIFLGVITELSPAQRTIALLGWPLILFFLALFEGAKEYRRLNKRDRPNAQCI